MLKGDIDFVVAAVIFVAVIVTLLLILQSGFVKTEAVRVGTQDKLNSIDTAHFIKGCLEKDGLIRDETLEGIPSLKEFCNLGIDPYVTVTDVDSSKNWQFGKERKGVSHTLPFSLLITETGEIHIGEIHVVV